MTREEIENMPAGQKMNELVAIHLFDWPFHDWATDAERHVCKKCGTTLSLAYESSEFKLCMPGTIPLYSQDIAAAWTVLEKVMKDNPDYSFIFERAGKSQTFWMRLKDTSHGTWTRQGGVEDVQVSDSDYPSFPLGVCIMVLKAKLVPE